MLDKYYERQLNYRKQLAIKVAKTPFAVCRLKEFSKKELVCMVDALLDFKIAVDFLDLNLDAKDIVFLQKCALLEALDLEFFERDNKESDL